MSVPSETTNKPESPTTVRPFEMDDDDGEEANAPSQLPASSTSNTARAQSARAEEAPPPQQPPRPVTEQQKNELILKEAFPSIELPVVRAVLSASRGNIESAFNALLEMTDPDATKNEPQPEEVPPPQPPRPSRNAQSQLEADELYARQLAEHYENVSTYEARAHRQQRGGHGHPAPQDYRGPPPRQSSMGKQQPHPNQQLDREYSFIDDDLPAIRENLKKGFEETQTRVNGWITNLKKKIDETFDDGPERAEGHGSGSFTGGQPGASRRSNDYDRFDADAEHLTDDFAGIKLAPDGAAAQSRPTVYRPPRSHSPHVDTRKVSFREEEDIYDSSPRAPGARPGAKASKWQPLSSVDPNPMAENDPFSLGDSDDDKDVVAKEAGGSKPAKVSGDSERLKQAAAEAMADSLVESRSVPATGDGSKD